MGILPQVEVKIKIFETTSSSKYFWKLLWFIFGWTNSWDFLRKGFWLTQKNSKRVFFGWLNLQAVKTRHCKTNWWLLPRQSLSLQRQNMCPCCFGYGLPLNLPISPIILAQLLPIHRDLASISTSRKLLRDFSPHLDSTDKKDSSCSRAIARGLQKWWNFWIPMVPWSSENTWGMVEANKFLHIGRLVDCFFHDFVFGVWGFLQHEWYPSRRELAKMQLLHGLILGIGFLTRHLDLKTLAKIQMFTLSYQKNNDIFDHSAKLR